MQIQIEFKGCTFNAKLHDTKTALAIYDNLPITASALVWGKEIYFEVDVQSAIEPIAKEEVNVGDLAFWPSGQCFCIFWGPTPMSRGSKPVAAARVNVFGTIEGDFKYLDTVKDGDSITIRKI